MSNSKNFLTVAAIALVALMGAVIAAEAKPGKGGCCKGGAHHWHHRHFIGSTYYHVTPGIGCGWLWRRYLATGIPSYKWRYYECIGG